MSSSVLEKMDGVFSEWLYYRVEGYPRSKFVYSSMSEPGSDTEISCLNTEALDSFHIRDEVHHPITSSYNIAAASNQSTAHCNIKNTSTTHTCKN